MGSSVEHFSIRGYAAKMRASDVAKCWPFGGGFSDARREAARAFLPPITVVKFQWWTDELDLLRSKKVISPEKKISGKVHENKVRSEIPESVHATASSRVPLCTADSRLSVPCSDISPHCSESTMRRLNDCSSSPTPTKEEKRRQESAMASLSKSSKCRMPKKRSIVEIFAVSPQVQTMHFDNDEDSRSESNDSDPIDPSKIVDPTVFVSNEKTKNREIRCSLKAIMGKIKKRKFKNLIKKCNRGMIERSPPRTSCFSRNVNGSTYNMKSSKDIVAAVSVHKKRSSLKYACVEKKHKLQTSKFAARQQNSVSLDHGGFRNQNKAICKQRSSVLRKRRGKISLNSRGGKQFGSHVRFCEETRIHGSSKNYFSSIGSPKSTCELDIAISSVNDKLTESNKELNDMEVIESDEDMSGNAVDECEDQPIVENKFAAGLHAHTGFLEEKHQYSGNSVFPGHAAVGDGFHVFCQGDKNCRFNPSLSPWYAGAPTVPSVVSNQSSCFIPRACSDSGKLFNYFRDSPSNVVSMTTMPNTKSLTQSSYSIPTDAITSPRLPFLPQLTAQTCNVHGLNQQPLCYPSAEEFMGSSHSFPENNGQATVLGEKCSHGEFLGLPLNSRGELIQLGSTGTCRSNHLKEPTRLTVPCCSPPLFNRNRDSPSLIEKQDRDLRKAQANHFLMQNHENLGHNITQPSRLGNSDFEVTRGSHVHTKEIASGKHHSFCNEDSELNSKNISCCGHRQYCEFKSEMARERDNSEHGTQPTMRLMGKDVTVGKRGKDSQASEDGNIWTDKEIIAQHNPSSFPIRSQDLGFPPSLQNFNDHMVCPSDTQCNLGSKYSESGLSQPYFHQQNNRVLSYGCSTVGIPISNPHPLVNPPSPASIFNGSHDTQIPFLPSESMNSYFTASSLNMCQHLDSAEFMYKQGSGFSGPHLENKDHNHPILFQKSPQRLPPWLLHATEPNEISIPSQPYMGCRLNYSDTSGTNILTFPSVTRSPPVTYPYDSTNFCTKNSLGSAAFVLPRLIPVPPGSKPTCMAMNYKNRTKVKDRMRGKPNYFKDPDRVKQSSCRSNKRKLCDFPILERKLDSGGDVHLNATNGKFADVIQCTSEAFEIGSNRTKESRVHIKPAISN